MIRIHLLDSAFVLLGQVTSIFSRELIKFKLIEFIEFLEKAEIMNAKNVKNMILGGSREYRLKDAVCSRLFFYAA